MARAKGPRKCDFCTEEIDSVDRRQRYHQACREPARLAGAAARRRCGKCRQVKSPESFSNDSTRIDGKYPWCKACQNVARGTVLFQDPGAALNGHICPLCGTAVRGHLNRRFCSRRCKDRTKVLRERFGLTAEQYNVLLLSNDGCCPICLEPSINWHVDHNHVTGEVTGVVCNRCNIGALAASRHDVEFVRRLLAYLENPPTRQAGISARAPVTQESNLHVRWQWSARQEAS